MKAPAMFILGATGAGKSWQVSSLLQLQGITPIVACFDSGSTQVYQVYGMQTAPVWSPDQKDGFRSITDFLSAYPADKFLRIVDSWPGFEDVSVMSLKATKKALTLKDWGDLVGSWRDQVSIMMRSDNVILIGNVSDGQKTVNQMSDDGKTMVKVPLPPGAVICTPALSADNVLASRAPVVLPLSSGGADGVRSWSRQLGQTRIKYLRRQADGSITSALPGGEPDQRLVPVWVCTLADIWLSVRRE